MDFSMTQGLQANICLTLNPAFEIVELSETAIQVFGVNEAFTIADKDRHVRSLLASCVAGQSEDDLRASLRESLPDGDQLIDFLKSRDILVDVRPLGDVFVDYLGAAAKPLSYLQPAPRTAPDLAGARIRLVGTGALADACRRFLPSLGPVLSEDDDPDLVLVVSDTIDHVFMRDMNRTHMTGGKPILFAALDRFLVRVGPLVIPNESACFECFHHRLRSQLRFHREFDARVNGRRWRSQDAISAAAVQIGSTLVGTTIAGFFVQNGVLGRTNILIEQDLLTNTLANQPILKLPRCPVCGPAGPDRLQSDIYAPFTM